MVPAETMILPALCLFVNHSKNNPTSSSKKDKGMGDKRSEIILLKKNIFL
jgi:hypothetical protein